MRSAYPLLFERSVPGRRGADLPQLDVPELSGLVPQSLLHEAPLPLPELAEVDVVRHYTNLSRRNFGVDNGFYPLGSCTMKYNPKINEEVAPLFNGVHPLADADCAAGAIRLMDALEKALVFGLDAVIRENLEEGNLILKDTLESRNAILYTLLQKADGQA